MMIFAWMAFSLIGVIDLWAGSVEMAEASRFVRERQAARLSAASGRLSPAQALGLSRFYKTGDRWLIAVRHKSSLLARKTAEPDIGGELLSDPLHYEFKVLSVDEAQGVARIEVTKVNAERKPVADARLSRALLSIDRQFKLRAKELFYDRASLPVSALFAEGESSAAGFEPLPIELPDFSQATIVGAAGGGLVLLESYDLFQRPMKISWRRGEPWPSSVETNSSVSTTISMEMI